MTRISSMKEEFYAKLHAMETPTGLYEEDGSIQRTRQAMLAHVPENDPRILELRRMLNVTKHEHNTGLRKYDTTILKAHIDRSGLSAHRISVIAGMDDATFYYKMKTGKFKDHEIAGVEVALGLKDGEADEWLLL